MSPAQRRHYIQMKNALVTEIKGEAVVAQVALAKILKLRQITSNFAISPDGVAIGIEGPNPKMIELFNLIEELGDRQVIIWAQFHEEIETISAALGDKARTLYSKTEDKDDNIRAFKENQYRYLVAHPRSGGHGHTFVNASVEIFYSLDYSWEAYEQSRGRVHRAGQTQKVTYIHILAKDTIDETILGVLQRKADAAQILYEVMNESRN